MTKLTDEAITIIKEDRGLFIKIQAALGCTERTMYNYVNSNASELTKVSAINILVEHTNRALSELTTGGKLSKLLAK